ncbi:MAG: hypothetical protein AAGU76_17810 [Sedimentibacter sp.]|uniref:hypothetical protein n=1 Tax=Sedimentibacter sp. TaxID=1960295 RepID=UPI003159835C
MKKLLCVVLILIVSLSAGCSRTEPPDAIGAYEAAIDRLYMEDEALNTGIKYLAIDTSEMVNLTEENKKTLLKNLEKYGLTVLDATMEQLKEQGYIKDTNFEEGILFKIRDEKMKNSSVAMDVSKFRSGLGAIGYDGMVIKYRDGRWEITKSGSPWIS